MGRFCDHGSIGARPAWNPSCGRRVADGAALKVRVIGEVLGSAPFTVPEWAGVEELDYRVVEFMSLLGNRNKPYASLQRRQEFAWDVGF